MARKRSLAVAAVAVALACVARGANAGHDGRNNPNPVDTRSNQYAVGNYDGPWDGGVTSCPATMTTYGKDFRCPSVGVGDCTPGPTGGKNVCQQMSWEYANYKYYVMDQQVDLPKPFTGIPRVNIETNKEYKGQMALDRAYAGSIIGQALPGLVIAVMLLASMLLVCFFYIISSCCKCCGLCKCCFRPRPYTRKSLHVAKGVQLLFVALCFAGCIVIYAASPDVSSGVRTITSGLVNATNDLSNDVNSLQTTLAAVTTIGMSSTELNDLATAANTANREIIKTKNTVDKAQKDVQLAADIISGVLLGVAVITMVLSVLNFWRLLIIFSVLTSLILIVTWIVVGALAAVGVFLDDLCYTMDMYVKSPDSVSISKEIPCPNAKDVVEFGAKFREQINIMVALLNTQVQSHNNAAAPLNRKAFLCPGYEKQTWENLCGTVTQRNAGTWVSPLWSDEFANRACEAYHRGQLGGTSAAPSATFSPFVTWDCMSSSTPSGYYNYSLSASVKVDKQIGNIGNYYDGVSGVTTTMVNDITNVNNVIWQFESILKCDFISNTFMWVQPGCREAVDAIQLMWRGFIITATGYLCLWITMLVTIGRMSNADLMIDGGKFDAKKAGLI
jgi:F0F1-type ATP synthase assembly protein I